MSDTSPDQSMVRFFQDNVFPIVISLDQGKYPLPLIQQRWNMYTKKIFEIYNQTLNIEVVTADQSKVDCDDGVVCFDTGVRAMQPFLRIFVPTLSMMFKKFQQTFLNYDEYWKSYIIISLMHELEHAVLGWDGSHRDHDALIEEEIQVWARTCENIMHPLVSVYGWKLNGQDAIFYREWLNANCNPDHPSWRQFIMKHYERAYR